MCGIIGAYGKKAGSVDISGGLSLLKARGPDSQDIKVVAENLVMGATRLAMTDPLPRSNQPFSRDCYWITFNGEIYNHKELRSRLIHEHGIQFETLSDTEVLLRTLQIYGSNATKYLNGMYAFAFYDLRQGRLLLGRDHLGKKPLFFSIKEGILTWSSTLEPLRRLNQRRDLNEYAILEYLSFGYSLDPQTFSKDIFSIKPGSIYSFNGELKYDINSAPRFQFAENHNYSIRDALQKAVDERVDLHENVAISLSGGLDSSIVAFLARSNVSKLQTYSLRWKDSDKAKYNVDYEAARKIAKKLDLPFVGVDFEEFGTVESNLEQFLVLMGEPNSNPTGISLVPLYSRMASDRHKLVLTGDGSDEIFGGYPRYKSPLLRNRIRVFPEVLGRKSIALAKSQTSFWHKLHKLTLAFLPPDSVMLWSNFHWNFSPSESALLLARKDFSEELNNWSKIERAIRDLDRENLAKCDNALSNVMVRDHTIWLNNESNRKLDRISMGFSIEARSPFQDDRVVYAASDAMRKSKYKILDKRILSGNFPELRNIGIRQDKAGFISPVGHWIRSNPALIEKSFSTLLDSKIFKNEILIRRKTDHLSGDYRKISQLWSLIVLGYWLESFNKS